MPYSDPVNSFGITPTMVCLAKTLPTMFGSAPSRFQQEYIITAICVLLFSSSGESSRPSSGCTPMTFR
jgi:hypothetical protein